MAFGIETGIAAQLSGAEYKGKKACSLPTPCRLTGQTEKRRNSFCNILSKTAAYTVGF